MPQPGSLFIGDVTALTGITAGRIRHYETIGLIAPDHLESGYRTFRPADVRRCSESTCSGAWAWASTPSGRV